MIAQDNLCPFLFAGLQQYTHDLGFNLGVDFRPSGPCAVTAAGPGKAVQYTLQVEFLSQASAQAIITDLQTPDGAQTLIYYAMPVCSSKISLRPVTGTAINLSTIAGPYLTDSSLGGCSSGLPSKRKSA